ncbi:MAG: hypothetical protein JXR49_12960 [Acidobacteria bacterium]|nr:hypothetical protein [Acidobacteriota bacterium]
MKRIIGVLLPVFGLIILLSGCSSAPTEEIKATTDALESIETPDINTYAPESLAAAQDEMNKALAEVKTQEEKFALTRDYKQSVALLKSTNELVEKAANEAQANKAKAKADAETALAELPLILQEASDLLAKAPKGKDTKADLEAMQNDLKLAEENAVEANNAMAAEKYPDALAKSRTAKEKSSSIIEQVKSARQKLGRKS